MTPFAGPKLLAVGIGTVLLIAAIVGLLIYFNAKEQRHENQLVNTGVMTERAATAGDTLNTVENAHEAVINPQPDDVERMRSRYDRSTANTQ
jgi:hypothetical protein